jgi:integrase
MKTPTTFPEKVPKSFPFVAASGNSTAKIYQTVNRGSPEYKIPYRGEDGKRKFHRFSIYEGARDKGNEMLSQLATGNADAITLKARDKYIYTRATETLKPYGIALDLAAQWLADMLNALEGCNVLPVEAARFYAKRNPAKMPVKTVAEVVAEFIKRKEHLGKSGRYIEDLKHRLGYSDPATGKSKYGRGFASRFKADLIATIERAQIVAYLDGLELSPRSHNNYRRAIISLFEFAKRQKYMPADWNECEGIDTMSDGCGEIAIYTPEEIGDLLGGACEKLIPFLAIGAFAGLRAAEIARIDWADINFETGWITVKGKVNENGTITRIAKTGSRRLVPLCDNLRKWLKPYAGRTGKVWAYGHTYSYELIAALSKKIKVAWKQNALRHSFISYRVAQTQDVNRVAMEAGNSPAMIHGHYRELVTPARAAAWFAVAPAVAKS